MCELTSHILHLYWVAEPSVELGKVSVHQGHGTHPSSEVFLLAVFEYDFGALDELDNPVTRTYLNLVYAFLLHNLPYSLTNPGWTCRSSAFGTKPPPVQMFVSDAAQYFPSGIITWLFERDKKPGSVKIRENRRQAHAVARTLIDEKRENMRNGDQGKDVLSSLSKC